MTVPAASKSDTVVSTPAPHAAPQSMSRNTVAPATPVKAYQSTSSTASLVLDTDACATVVESKISASERRSNEASTFVALARAFPTSPATISAACDPVAIATAASAVAATSIHGYLV